MKVSDLGEFALIELISEILGPPPPTTPQQPGILIGIGDDAALWRTSDSLQILTTDTMIEGVHFRLETTTCRDLGWKVLATNLSDIAAMGGVPKYAVVSLGLTPDTEVDSVADLYRGMADIAREYGCLVVGGDTMSAPAMMITVSLTGQTSSSADYPDNVLTRSRAQVGQRIGVTGYLGASEAGLRTVSEGLIFDGTAIQEMQKAHNHPTPRIAEGQALLQLGIRTAMDISDGLMADLPKMCKASGVAARIMMHCIPIHPIVKRVFGEKALEIALSGGEDYELLFTVDAPLVNYVKKACPTPVTIIGEIVAGKPGKVAVINEKGIKVKWKKGGWEHFTPSGGPRTKAK